MRFWFVVCWLGGAAALYLIGAAARRALTRTE
jgi:hypothetical protein